MPAPKVIYKEKFNLRDEESSRLSYEDLFSFKDEVDISVADAIERNNIDWNKKLTDARKSSLKEGYDAGFEDGVRKAREEIDAKVGAFEQVLMQIDQRLDKLVEDLRPGITTLVFDLAEKVIEVPVRTEALEAKLNDEIGRALKSINESAKVHITVSGYDYDVVKPLVESTAGKHAITIDYDDNLRTGEYRIETTEEAVISNYRKSLKEIRDNLSLDEWGKEQAG